MHEKYCKTYFYNGQNYLFFMSVTAVATQQPSEFRDEVDKESKWQNKIYLLAELWGFVFVIINHICTYKSIRSVRRAAQPQYRNTFLQRRLILTLHDGFLIKTHAHIKGSVHQEKYNGHRLLVDHTRTFRRMFMLFFPYSESEWRLGGQAPRMTKKHHKSGIKIVYMKMHGNPILLKRYVSFLKHSMTTLEALYNKVPLMH